MLWIGKDSMVIDAVRKVGTGERGRGPPAATRLRPSPPLCPCPPPAPPKARPVPAAHAAAEPGRGLSKSNPAPVFRKQMSEENAASLLVFDPARMEDQVRGAGRPRPRPGRGAGGAFSGRPANALPPRLARAPPRSRPPTRSTRASASSPSAVGGPRGGGAGLGGPRRPRQQGAPMAGFSPPPPPQPHPSRLPSQGGAGGAQQPHDRGQTDHDAPGPGAAGWGMWEGRLLPRGILAPCPGAPRPLQTPNPSSPPPPSPPPTPQKNRSTC
jgi:type VI secretion system secreted protein VgrG